MTTVWWDVCVSIWSLIAKNSTWHRDSRALLSIFFLIHSFTPLCTFHCSLLICLSWHAFTWSIAFVWISYIFSLRCKWNSFCRYAVVKRMMFHFHCSMYNTREVLLRCLPRMQIIEWFLLIQHWVYGAVSVTHISFFPLCLSRSSPWWSLRL